MCLGWPRRGYELAATQRNGTCCFSASSVRIEARRSEVQTLCKTRASTVFGASFEKTVRRAAHIADGFYPGDRKNHWGWFRDECIKIGRRNPGEAPKHCPTLIFVAEDPEKAWADVLLRKILEGVSPFLLLPSCIAHAGMEELRQSRQPPFGTLPSKRL